MNKWNKIKSSELYKEMYGSIFSPVLISLIGMVIQIAIIKIVLDLLFSLQYNNIVKRGNENEKN